MFSGWGSCLFELCCSRIRLRQVQALLARLMLGTRHFLDSVSWACGRTVLLRWSSNIARKGTNLSILNLGHLYVLLSAAILFPRLSKFPGSGSSLPLACLSRRSIACNSSTAHSRRRARDRFVAPLHFAGSRVLNSSIRDSECNAFRMCFATQCRLQLRADGAQRCFEPW